MKETSGEFSMTVVVIIGAIIIVGILVAMGPSIANFINNSWSDFGNKANGTVNNDIKINVG